VCNCRFVVVRYFNFFRFLLNFDQEIRAKRLAARGKKQTDGQIDTQKGLNLFISVNYINRHTDKSCHIS
jgi:hypothetical protein